jgi:hypothetical protein
MTKEARTAIDERRKHLQAMKRHYKQAHRKTKGQLLGEMELVTGLHRRSLTRLMNSSQKRKPRRRERGKTYGPDVDDALRVIDESFDYICAERLTPTWSGWRVIWSDMVNCGRGRAWWISWGAPTSLRYGAGSRARSPKVEADCFRTSR